MDEYIVEEGYERKTLPYMTIFLVAVNVIIFMIMESMGSTVDVGFMYKWGAMDNYKLFEAGNWYRIFTSMFLHFGLNHLLNNMVVLLAIGYHIEEKFGRIKFLLVYLWCGIVGNIISGLINTAMGNFAVSAGASGAIFGMFGVLLVMVFKSRKLFGRMSAIQLIILFLLMVFGNIEEGVDWIAHLFGAMQGVALAMFCYKPKSADDALDL